MFDAFTSSNATKRQKEDIQQQANSKQGTADVFIR